MSFIINLGDIMTVSHKKQRNSKNFSLLKHPLTKFKENFAKKYFQKMRRTLFNIIV